MSPHFSVPIFLSLHPARHFDRKIGAERFCMISFDDGAPLRIPRDPSLRVGPPLSHTDAAFRMTSVFFVSQPDQQGRNHREDGLTQRRRRTQRKVFPTPLRPLRPLREALLEAWTSFLQGTFPTQRLPARTATAAGGDGLFYSPQEEAGDDEHHLRGLRAAGAALG